MLLFVKASVFSVRVRLLTEKDWAGGRSWRFKESRELGILLMMNEGVGQQKRHHSIAG